MVTMIEVPDKEDDTAYRWWVAKGSPLVSLTRHEVALPTPPESLKTPTKTLHWDSRCTNIIPPKGTPTSPPPNKEAGLTHIRKDEVTSPTVAMSSETSAKVQEAPH